jgi:hypothetical protein
MERERVVHPDVAALAKPIRLITRRRSRDLAIDTAGAGARDALADR